MRPIFANRTSLFYSLLVLGLFLLPIKAQAQAQDTQTLHLGILPFQSASSLFKRYAPLREYLSAHTQRNVRLDTAPDFPEFVKRSANREYDILFTAPHLALLALRSGHYELAATITTPLNAVIAVPENSPIKHMRDLQGKVVATPPELAIITKLGKRHFTLHQVAPVFKTYASHNASQQAAYGGDTSAAIFSNDVYDGAMSNNMRMRVVDRSENIPAMGLLLLKDLDPGLKQQILHLFIDMHLDPEGQDTLARIFYFGFRATDENEFKPLEEFLP